MQSKTQATGNYLNYKDVLSEAEATDRKLLATDPRFRHSVQVVCEDGSVFFWNGAFMEEHRGGDWLMVFTEHYGFYVYCIEDLLRYAEYERTHG